MNRMKRTNLFLVAATAAIATAACVAAQAQVGRLGARNAAESDAVSAAPATRGSNAAIPGTTRPLQSADSAATGATASSAPLTKSDGSEFVIPANATPEELVDQASSLLATDIAFESESEYAAWVSKMLQTVGKIADRILTLKPDDKYFVEAISLKGQVLCYQASLDSSALPKLKQYADALAKNKRAQSLEDGRNAALAFTGVYLQAVVADIAERQGTEKELKAAMAEVNAFIKAHPETSDLCVDLVFPVVVIASNLERPELPEEIWAPIRETLGASETPEAQNALVMLDGAIRYSTLVGSPFEWKGCDLDGKPLDESKVKGRVVLVDFWASWAEQCAETHKKLRELYDQYHAQGFEIVGYSLDPKLEDTRKYASKNKIPWIMLSDRATVDANETSLAGYYGISEIPTLILVGGDGKVASTDLSLESLEATLKSVFSPKALAPKATSSESGKATSSPKITTATSGTTSGPTTRRTTRAAGRP